MEKDERKEKKMRGKEAGLCMYSRRVSQSK
jgi:hypothetical protein